MAASNENMDNNVVNLGVRLLSVEKKIEKLEKSFSSHEITFAKKISELNELEKGFEELASREELENIKKSLGVLNEHEDLIFENTKYIRELVAEIEKLRESHKIFGESHTEKIEKHTQEHEESLASIRNNIDFHASDKEKLKRDVSSKLLHLEVNLSDKMDQIEYQNKLIMRYLKKIDERIFSK